MLSLLTGRTEPERNMEIPRRYSLATQAAESIRRGIAEGRWNETLPGERSLCELLQISRPTLKGALEILRHEGLVEIRDRRRARILKKSSGRLSPRRRTVVLLTGTRLHQHAVNALTFIGKLQQALSNADFQLVVLDHPQFARNLPRASLRKVSEDNEAVCYLLMSVSLAVQNFFFETRLPTVVFGSLFPGVQLPSCDWNYPAMGFHAAGVFLRNEHRYLCFVRPSQIKKGDRECETGFRGVVEKHKDIALTVVSNNGEASRLYREVQRIFRAAKRPSAIFVMDPYDCLTVLFALENLKLKVPEEVSVISIDWANIFRPLPFKVASYADSSRFIRKSAQLVLNLACNQVLPAKENLVMPEFHAGDTVSKRA
jgi:DNA-binding LacI/PurR family transcriptional regulator